MRLDAPRAGTGVGAAGFDPSELPYRVVATGDHWRLRDYAGSDTSEESTNGVRVVSSEDRGQRSAELGRRSPFHEVEVQPTPN